MVSPPEMRIAKFETSKKCPGYILGEIKTTVELPIKDTPRRGQPLYNGQSSWSPCVLYSILEAR